MVLQRSGTWGRGGTGGGTRAARYTEAMAIDERLERLTERPEALTQTVELMAAENRERDRRLSEIMEAIARLAHVAEIHERRLTDLEGGE